MDGLDKFISSLDKAIATIPEKTKVYKKELFASILYEIGRRTADDTGVTRGIIQDVLRSLGKGELASSLEEPLFQFWKTLEERLEESSDYYFDEDQNGNMTLVVNDYGFAGQQEYGHVSAKHPRNDPLVIPMQVDFVMDAFNLGQFSEIESGLNKFLESIVNTIEKGR